MRDATAKPALNPSLFHARKPLEAKAAYKPPDTGTQHRPNVSKRRAESTSVVQNGSICRDDFDDDGIDDDELMEASCGDLNFDHIENYANPVDIFTRDNTKQNKARPSGDIVKAKGTTNLALPPSEEGYHESMQLPNGKWACNHPCKDKTACKHLCCKTGMDKPPKKKSCLKMASVDNDQDHCQQGARNVREGPKQTKIQLTAAKRKTAIPIEELDLTQQGKKTKVADAVNLPSNYRDLHQLHTSFSKTKLPTSLHSVVQKKPIYSYSEGGDHTLSFLAESDNLQSQSSSDYGDVCHNDFAGQAGWHDLSVRQDGLSLGNERYDDRGLLTNHSPVVGHSRMSDTFDDDDSMLADAMIGLADSQTLREAGTGDDGVVTMLEEDWNTRYDLGLEQPDRQTEGKAGTTNIMDLGEHQAMTMAPAAREARPEAQHPLRYVSKLTEDCDTQATKSIFSMRQTQNREQRKVSPDIAREVNGNLVEENSGESYPTHTPTTSPDSALRKDAKPVHEAFKDLEPWMFHEFGDIVELEME